MTKRSTLLALFASAAFAGLTGQAFALDGNDVLAKINAVTSLGNTTIAAESVATDGTTVTLSGTKLNIEGVPEGVAVGTVTLEGVEEADGGYTIEKIGFADVNMTEADTTVSIKDIAIAGVEVPADPQPGTLSSLMLYDTASTGPINVTVKGKQVVSIASISSTMELAEDESSMSFGGGVSGIAVDMTTVEDPKAKEAFEALGLTSLNGEVTLAGTWTLADGKLDLTEYAFDFDNVGRLDVTFSLSGYTLEFLKAMQDASKAAAANPDAAAGQQAMGMAMMGLAQQLSFNGASIRFDDAGITTKALDYAGAQQGVDGKQMAESLKGMVPLMIGQLNMPELQTAISNAINTYLDDPKSIEIAAEPASPVPVPQIMGAAMGAPQTLPQVLGVKITANE